MIPGTISKLSEIVISLTATIPARTDVIRVSTTTTTTVLVTMTPMFPQNNGIVWIINSSGAAITTTTAGNFATTTSIPNGTMCAFIYSKSSGKWHPEKVT